MTPNAQLDVDYLRSLGVTFLPSFLGGASGVIARYDLPLLSYPSSFSQGLIDQITDGLNSKFRSTFKGCGYYGHCPQGETDSGGNHVYVLFADDEFYNDYRSGSLDVTG